MTSWHDYHSIDLVLGTILQTIDCVYLQLPCCNPHLAEGKASQCEPCHILHPMTSVVCACSTARHWLPCWMVAQVEQPENFSVLLWDAWGLSTDSGMWCQSNARRQILSSPWVLNLDYIYPFFPPWTPFSFPPVFNTSPATWTLSTSHDLNKTMPLIPKLTR